MKPEQTVYKYYIVYSYIRNNALLNGSGVITRNNPISDILDISEIRETITELQNFKQVVILSWQELLKPNNPPTWE